MIIRTDSIKEISNIICDNILIKDKTVIIIDSKPIIDLITKDVLLHIEKYYLDINIRISDLDFKQIGEFILMGIIDGSRIRGLRAKNIIIYNYEILKEKYKDHIENIINGYNAISE